MQWDIPGTKFTWTWTSLQDLTYEYCDIIDQVRSLLKYWKNVNFDFIINLNFAFAFFNFLFYSK